MIYFTPGPSQLYPTVAEHVQNVLNEGFCSISHRSKPYEKIHQAAVENLRHLLSIPDNFQVFFTSSATETWDRTIENCVAQHSYHFVNGTFSKRFYETSLELGRNAKCNEALLGKGFSNIAQTIIPKETELICITHNETSTGVMIPFEDINALRTTYPDKLIAVDAVSSLPYGDLDYNKVDIVLFSVQKGFGLPAGLGVWMVNDRCIAKAETLHKQGHRIGSYHSIPSLLSKAKLHQTPETPNMLGIYLLSKVTEDMLKKGIKNIRQETEEKASLIYDFIEQTAGFEIFVKEKAYRSNTVIVANTEIPSSEINKTLAPLEMTVGAGYGKYVEQQIRIANFPAVSLDGIKRLINVLQSL